MSGTMQWFRWHHGSVTDPKFNLVARKAGASLPEVLAVWAFLLETASASTERGNFGEVDCEAVDCLFGMDDGKTALILEQMSQRGLIESGSVSSWEKRQPKREREDDSSTERSRAFRQRKRNETPQGDCATPRNATQRQETPRLDKRRLEESNTPLTPQGAAPDGAGGGESPITHSAGSACTKAGSVCLAMKAAGIADTNPGNPKLRALIDAGADLQEFVGAAQQAVSAGSGRFSYALGIVAGERKRAAEMAGKLHQGDLPAAETAYQRSMRERVAEFAPSIARQAPAERPRMKSPVEFFNTIEVPARTVGALK